MKYHFRNKRAFTLIELLTVIVIMLVLAALLFPAIKLTLTKGEVIKAQSAAQNLSGAFRAYYTEYGKWPVADTGAANTNITYIVDANLVALLQGVNNTTVAGLTITGSTGTSGPFAHNPSTSTLQGNPRGIHFLDFKPTDIDSLGDFVDPWKQPYYCRFDISYANSLADPFTGGGGSALTNVGLGVLVWSSGPDGQYDNQGDAGQTVPVSPLNKDNVKSW
jgi:prepilin-type N-terminal cleavage/methylation domain-containing protein